MRSAKAFSPSGISSFFEICDTLVDGSPICDAERIGARGGGFGIRKGTTTEVTVSDSALSEIRVLINGQESPQAETTKAVARTLLEKCHGPLKVLIKHVVQVPIGAGFGTSAAGALNTALALSNALDLNLTYNQLGRIAHVAEVKCKTGLGTVGPLMLGGCMLTTEPGAPGIAVIDRIPLPEDYVIVAGMFGSIPTEKVLSSSEKRLAVNKWGRKIMEQILIEPSVENFLVCCRAFAEKTGFATDRVRNLMELAEKAGAIGAAQNMVGEAVHALTTSEDAANVVQAFKRVLPEDRILTAKIDFQGARLSA